MVKQPLGNKFISDIQLYDKYARWIPAEQRRESWPEVTERVIKFLRTVPESAKLPASTWDVLKSAMLNKEVLPSMRIVQMAGPALERCHVGAYNPVAADTLVLTERGYVPIKQLEGTNTNVLNKDSRWVPATFQSYGVQPVHRVVLRRHKGRTDREVKATGNHRWVKQNGTVVSTEELQIGDRLPSAYAPKDIASQEDYAMGIKHGIVYGDGTNVYSYKRHSGYNIRLCGDKTQLLTHFSSYKVSYPASFNGEPVVYLYDSWAKTHDLKSLPVHESASYVLGFMRGLQATDGFVSANVVGVTVPTAIVESFVSMAARVGFSAASSRVLPMRTNYGLRNVPLTTLSWDNDSLQSDDFLLPTVWESKSVTGYRVVAVDAPVEDVEVLCAHVPDTNTFTLANGIVTGNCAYTTLTGPKSLAELLYILMQGTGVGYSVESKYVDQWPRPKAARATGKSYRLLVHDSTEGWCEAFRDAIEAAMNARAITFDYTQIRPEGAWLHTKGGRASGPEPLRQLLDKTSEIIRARAGLRLRPIDIHRLATMCGSIVQVGGVRRAAELALFDKDDREMRDCKEGEFWNEMPELAMANNSRVSQGPVNDADLLKWMSQLANTGSGEPGIFRRDGAIPERRNGDHEFGTNPCGEIILRPQQFCNLSVAVARPDDTEQTLLRKVTLATVLGTVQSCLTNFQYLGGDWKVNCDEERLLGVDITGACDCPLLIDPDTLPTVLRKFRDQAVRVNVATATLLGIPVSAAVTCNKPSGNSAQFLDTSSGIHARYAPFYIRRLRLAARSPLALHLQGLGLPIYPEVAQGSLDEARVWVVELPVKSPDSAMVRADLSAVDQLSYWLMWKLCWTEHNPSCTIYVRPDEWVSVTTFLRLQWQHVGGLSFMPKDEHTYALAPYEEIDEGQYTTLVAALPQSLDLGSIREAVDVTTLSQEYACVGGICET